MKNLMKFISIGLVLALALFSQATFLTSQQVEAADVAENDIDFMTQTAAATVETHYKAHHPHGGWGKVGWGESLVWAYCAVFSISSSCGMRQTSLAICWLAGDVDLFGGSFNNGTIIADTQDNSRPLIVATEESIYEPEFIHFWLVASLCCSLCASTSSF